jgi:hypothetical protein
LKTAYSILPHGHRFADGRAEAILDGLAKHGYVIDHRPELRGRPLAPDMRPKEGDLLVTWTVHRGGLEDARDAFERMGGRVVVCEEAHLKIINGEKYYAICLHDHNGAGRWWHGGSQRWVSWRLHVKPWRTTGGKILVREQRGIASAGMTAPPDWHNQTAQKLRTLTTRTVETVTHPKILKRQGVAPPDETEQLRGIWCVVTWNSHMGTVALLNGVPVIFQAPHFFMEKAAGRALEEVKDPPLANRLPAFERLAWAQWSRRELASGKAFEALLQCR